MTQRSPFLALALALSTGCAGLQAAEPAPPLDRRLASIGNVGTMSSFEIRTLYAARETPPAVAREDQPRRKPITPILFGLGLGIGAVAGAAAIGTGISSVATRRQLDNSYFDGGYDLENYNRIVDRGETLSNATIGLGVTAALMFAVAIVTYGVDWTRCGPLAPARRRADAPPRRCRDRSGKPSN